MSGIGYRRQLAKERAAKAWRSGFCEVGNCGYCKGGNDANPERAWTHCACRCHEEPIVVADHAEPSTALPAGLIKPGLHFDLPNDDYHALTDWFSSTQLKKALPEHYKTGGSQEALDFGTLVHAVVLEPDNLGHYVVLDAAKIAGDNPKTGKPYDAPHMTARFKAAAAEAAQDGRTVVAQADWDTAHRMRDAVAKHPTAARLLFEGEGACEESAFAIDAGGIQHKARFDRRIPGAILDLKTTASKPGANALTRTVIDYGYELSAAHYLAVAALLDLDVQGFGWIFCDKSEGIRVTVVDVDEAFLGRGRVLREKAIRRLTDPTAEPYEGSTGYLTLTLPAWAQLREDEA